MEQENKETTVEVEENIENKEQKEQKNSFDAEKALKTLEDALPGRVEKILKGIVKSNGGTEEDFKVAKEKLQENSTENELNLLKEQLGTLKNELYKKDFDISCDKIAKELNIREDKLNYVKKLANFTKINDENGNLQIDKIKESLENVVKDLPEFLISKEQKLDFKINGNGNKIEIENIEENDKIRKMWGLPTKK